MFGWFNAKEANAFGEELAAFLAERLPLDERDARRAPHKKREVLAKLMAHAQRFAQVHPLNVYRKARLGSAFKWKLIDLGYEKDFVEEVTKEVLLKL
jgi:hypothetical protein